MKEKAQQLIRTELVRYVLVGGIAVGVDMLVYYLLTSKGIAEPSWAKRISFIAGGIWSFCANKFFTFRSAKLKVSEPILFVIVYTISFSLNTIVHDLLLSWFHNKLFALLTATGISVVWNYIGQKWLVFSARKKNS